ncbi:MAG: twin-arginine translocase subunit TatC, partial [Deltaproteobacteria bacterium]|nr:twin-arginine translocase subunit TatC [Deltaproteobacteria bacterium]
MTFLEHLTEFRTRLIRSMIALVATSVVGLVFSKKIFLFLQTPMLAALPEGGHFIATNPFESYVTYFKVALLAGLFLASPYIFFQLWNFLSPGLSGKEKNLLLPS